MNCDYCGDTKWIDGNRCLVCSPEEVRYRIEQIKLIRLQRLRLWWSGVLSALTESPPTHSPRYVEVKPVEFGYNDAPYAAEFVRGPRFEFKNGSYEQIPE